MTNESARRPYGATANKVAVLNRARNRNLPEILNAEFYRIAGVPDVSIGRVSEGMEFLGFVEADGTPTDLLRAIASASDAEYRELLAGAIRKAYAEDFQRIDPSQDDQSTIIDAFRRYEPRSQTSRMVMLFLGLCREAGIPVMDAPRERKMQPRTPKARTPKQARGTANTGGVAKVDATPTIAMPMSNTLFAVSNEDIAALSDTDFTEVWNALGKVARARSRVTIAVPAAANISVEDDEDDDADIEAAE